jgi:hypothetical protein
MIDWQRLLQRANDDGEFRLHARFWNARVRITRGEEERTVLEIVAGEVRSAQPWNPADYGAELEIAAPAADWDALLQPLPKPFYQDVWAASVHHGFHLAGDRHHLCAYYPAVRRLMELMREVRHAAV